MDPNTHHHLEINFTTHTTSPYLPTNHHHHHHTTSPLTATSPTTSSSSASASASASASTAAASSSPTSSRYENQKRRDWNTFGQYLRNHKPPLTLSRCSGAHVLEFLRYLDQFGKTKVHAPPCPFYGHPNPPAPCPCPLRQAWGSLDALVGRLRAAYEENGGKPETNPFGARAVRLYLREVRDLQSKARGVSYEKKKRKRPPPPPPHPPNNAANKASTSTEASNINININNNTLSFHRHHQQLEHRLAVMFPQPGGAAGHGGAT